MIIQREKGVNERKHNPKGEVKKVIKEFLTNRVGRPSRFNEIAKYVNDNCEPELSPIISFILKQMIIDGDIFKNDNKDYFIRDEKSPHPEKDVIVGDIFEYLISDPYGDEYYDTNSSVDKTIWTAEDIKAVLPKYTIENIKKAFSLNQNFFEYIPGRGWRARSVSEDFE